PDVHSTDEGGAGGRAEQTDHHLDGGGFTCSIGAEEAKELAAADNEVEAVDGDLLTECLGKTPGSDRSVRRGESCGVGCGGGHAGGGRGGRCHVSILKSSDERSANRSTPRRARHCGL